MTVRFKSEYNHSYRVPRCSSVSPQRCLPLAGLRSDHMGISREPQLQRRRKLASAQSCSSLIFCSPAAPPTVHHRKEVSVEHKPSRPPAAKPGSPAGPGTPTGPRPAADPPENPGVKPRPLQPNDQSQQSRQVTPANDGQQQQQQQQLDQVDPALWRKAGLKGQRSAGQKSEYQRQFRWRMPAPITSPILTAEQMLYSRSTSNRPFKKHPVPLTTEYQQNYKGLAPPTRPRLREHVENQRVALFQRRRTPPTDQNQKATPPTDQNQKATPPRDRSEKATPPLDKNGKATPPTEWNKKDDPYGQEVGSPWKATPPPNVKRQLRNTVVGVASVGDAQQVRELRLEALQHRRRAWGTHFSREHLSQLQSEHNALWDATETTDTPTDTPRSPPDSSSPAPASVEALDLGSESSRTSTGGTKRSVQTAPSVRTERRATSEDDEDDFTDDEGRLPTPQLKTRPVQRTHLDLTTPSTGGAILVGRLREAADWSLVKQRGPVPISKATVKEPAPSPPVSTKEAWSEVAHASALSPSPSPKPPRSSAKPIRLKETPPPSAAAPPTVAPPPQRIQGTLRHPDFQHNGDLGLRLGDFSCSGKNCGSDDDDRLSVMSWRSAASCSAASDVLRRALKRRDHFWEKA